MPLPPPLVEKLRRRKAAKDGEIVLKGIEPSRRNERIYRADLNRIIRDMVKEVRATLLPELKRLEPEYIADAFSISLRGTLDALRIRFRTFDVRAERIAEDAANREFVHNRNQTKRALPPMPDLLLSRILITEGMADTVENAVAENVELIRSIPAQYLTRLANIVYDGTSQGRTAGTLTEQIRNLNNRTYSRAKVISRDRTAKMNAAITRTRQLNLGVDEYVWETSMDERVRDSHRRNHGKTFRWDKPPTVTGHPGEDTLCRCVARAVVKL